ncbi:MAG: hypothetical protein KC583_11045, partial [Myxococcales bacterium]|nr:hypothetical protein [Myxococcales bacterium]
GVFGLVLLGYPNWVVTLSVEGPTVWARDAFGAVPADVEAGAHQKGVALAWPDRAGRLVYGFMGDDGRFARPPAPLVGGPTAGAASVQVAARKLPVALAWDARAEDASTVHVAVVDAVSGEPADPPRTLGEGESPTLADDGDSGYVVGYHQPVGARLRLVWQRLTTGGAPRNDAVEVTDRATAPGAVDGNYYLEEVVAAWPEEDRIYLRRFDEDGPPVAEAVQVAEGLDAPREVRLVREDRRYAVFWVDGPEDAPNLRARVFTSSARPLGPMVTVAQGITAYAATVAGVAFGVAWSDADRGLHVGVGDLGCAPAE